MTTITQKDKSVYVNGRFADFGQIDDIKKERAGLWKGYTVPRCGDKYEFEISGGTAAGGAANEWYLRFPFGFGDQWVRYNSAKAAIEAIGKV